MHTLFTPIRKAIAITCLFSLNSVTYANEDSHHNHEAHVHGYAQLSLAAENRKLLISITTPANSLVGFEHRAETPEERAKITVLKANLKNAQNIISLSKPGCKLTNVNIDLDGLLPLKTDDKHAHHEEEHHEHHDEKDHHEDEHHEDEHEEAEHNEVMMDYSYHCDKGATNNSATIHLFKHYPAVKAIEAMWISDSNQGSTNLTPDSNTLVWK